MESNKENDLKQSSYPNAFWAWRISFLGMLISLIIQIIAKPLGAIGGIIFIGSVILGSIFSILCLTKLSFLPNARKHGLIGVAVNLVLIIFIVYMFQLINEVREKMKSNARDKTIAAKQDKSEGETSEQNLDLQPALNLNGKKIIFPKDVIQAPKNYLGALGIKPLALIKTNNKVSGEIYYKILPKSANEEFNELVNSGRPGDRITVTDKGSFPFGGSTVDFATLEIAYQVGFGIPWILHNTYIPEKNGSSTLKLVTSTNDFQSCKTIFDQIFQD